MVNQTKRCHNPKDCNIWVLISVGFEVSIAVTTKVSVYLHVTSGKKWQKFQPDCMVSHCRRL